MKKKIGIFGGSFDPFHLGHLNLAVRLYEKVHLDQILLCPANISPFKQNTPPAASKEHRAAMLQILLKEIPFFDLTTLELKRPPPSYMIDTITELYQENRDKEYFLILTDEVLQDFHKWKEHEKILKLTPPLVGLRHQNALPIQLKEIVKRNIYEIPLYDVSSTEIRMRLSKRLYCGHLVPSKILDYISKNQLYLS